MSGNKQPLSALRSRLSGVSVGMDEPARRPDMTVEDFERHLRQLYPTPSTPSDLVDLAERIGHHSAPTPQRWLRLTGIHLLLSLLQGFVRSPHSL